MKDYYVTLTGAVNNAGDFLIRRRAIALIKKIRPDRDVIDFPRREPLDNKSLEIVNSGRALLLTGGPSVQKDMYPEVYPLVKELQDIKVPIVLFGVGWKGDRSAFEDCKTYSLKVRSRPLLERLEEDGLCSSVRDYETARILKYLGLSKIMMTGCPALQRADEDPEYRLRPQVNRILFSVGVKFVRNGSLERQMKSVITLLRKEFGERAVTAVFQHSLDREKLKYALRSDSFSKRNEDFCRWLEEEGIEYRDISESAENMLELYDTFDAHIGYRVHSHICAVSLGLASVLLCEDARGEGLVPILGSGILPAYSSGYRNPYFRLDWQPQSIRRALDIAAEACGLLKDETACYPTLRSDARAGIQKTLSAQERFLGQLP